MGRDGPRGAVRRGAAGGLPAAGSLLIVLLAGPAPAGEAPDGRGRSVEDLMADCRSGDAFFRDRAEGELRRRGAECLPALARELDGSDPDFRLRVLRLCDDILRLHLDGFDADSLALTRDAKERDALLHVRATLPAAVAKLREEIAKPAPPSPDPEEERRAATERAEKAARIRAGEEALREASDERLADVEARLRDREKKVEEGQKVILAAGLAAFGPLLGRREATLAEIVPAYDALLAAIRERIPEADLFPAPGGPPGASGNGSPAAGRGADRQPEDLFEKKRALLAPVWAWEVERKGGLAARAEPLLAAHVEKAIDDLRSGSALRRERAEEELFALGGRSLAAIRTRASVLPPGVAERLESLIVFRIHPRVEERTGIDFRGYPDLPFRARRRLVIHYGRVAGRDSIPTLRLIALGKKPGGEDFEPSLRIRLAAAEALAGPTIRDRSAVQAFERLAMPELLKIPQIARELALLNGIQLTEEKRYEEAIAEFRKVLDESPYDFRANYQIAFAYLLIKNYAKAILHFEIARRVQPDDDLTLYNLACAYSLDGQADKALEALGAAVKAGFIDYRHIEQDPDLAPLRKDPRFHELVDRLKRSAEEDGEKRAPGKKAGKKKAGRKPAPEAGE